MNKTRKVERPIVYGPIDSRRLGFSLGIDLSPAGQKQCTLNCVYCECGPTPDRGAAEDPAELPWPKPADVEKSLIKAIEQNLEFDYITFAGTGEPTLHPQFGLVVDRVIQVRNKMSPASDIALLSNAVPASQAKVKKAISNLDVAIMKLDAGDEETFQRINQPSSGITLEKIVKTLKSIPGIYIQTLFLDGPLGNSAEDQVAAWVARLQEIQPKSVQIYTIDRPTPKANLRMVSADRLNEIAAIVLEAGLSVCVYEPTKKAGSCI